MNSSPPPIDVPETIEGPRILLRAIRPEDEVDLAAAIQESRERLAPWMPWVHGDTSAGALRRFSTGASEEWTSRKSLQMLIFDRATGRLLGNSGFPRLDWSVRSFEIGYWLRTSAEGHGFMTEAVRLLTQTAFRPLQANRVEIRVDPRNTRSCRVAERLGYVLEGTLRNCALDGEGRISDRHVFALTPEDFQRLTWAMGTQVPT